MVIFHSFLYVYQRVHGGLSFHGFRCWPRFSEQHAKNDVNHEVFFQNSDKIFIFTWVMCPDRTQYHCVTYPDRGGLLRIKHGAFHLAFQQVGSCYISLFTNSTCMQAGSDRICSNSAFSEQQNLSFHEQTIRGKLLYQCRSWSLKSVEMMRFFCSKSMNQKSDLDELSEVHKSQRIPRPFWCQEPGPFVLGFHIFPPSFPSPIFCQHLEAVLARNGQHLRQIFGWWNWLYCITHDGSMYAIYGNMDPINIPHVSTYTSTMDPMGHMTHIYRIRRISNPRHLSSKQFTGRSEAEQLSQKDSCGFPSADAASRYPRLPFKITKKKVCLKKILEYPKNHPNSVDHSNFWAILA